MKMFNTLWVILALVSTTATAGLSIGASRVESDGAGNIKADNWLHNGTADFCSEQGNCIDDNADAIGAISSSVDGAVTKANEAKSAVDALSGSVTQNAGEIVRVESESAARDTAIETTLNSGLSNAASERNRIENDSVGRDNVLSGRISENSGEIDELYAAHNSLSTDVQANTERINSLEADMRSLEKKYRAGTASAIAIGNLPQAPLNHSGFVVGAGYYGNEMGYAVGWSTTNETFGVKVGVSRDSYETGAGLSAGFWY